MKRRKTIVGIIICVAALFLLASTTYSWLTRNENDDAIAIKGFSYTGNLVVLPDLFTVETYFKNPNGEWTKLSEGLEIPASEEYGKGLVKLLPGYRTEFKSIITNISTSTISYSAYLNKVYVNNLLANYVTFGAYEPELNIYKKSDLTLEDGNYYIELAQLNESSDIEPGAKVTIKWYISLDKAYQNQGFYALCDSDGNPITVKENDEDYFYCVIEYSAFENKIYHAYKVNSIGEFVDNTNDVTFNSNKLVEYTGDYSICTAKYFDYLSHDFAVKIEGLFVAAGKKSGSEE